PHWLAHYHALGVTDVHLVLNGSSPNRRLLRQACRGYAVTVAEEHDQPDSDEARREVLARLVRGFAGEWVLVAGADEFGQLPFLSLPATLRALRAFGMTALPAISVQRVGVQASLPKATGGSDLPSTFPFASTLLVERLAGTIDPPVARTTYPL